MGGTPRSVPEQMTRQQTHQGTVSWSSSVQQEPAGQTHFAANDSLATSSAASAPAPSGGGQVLSELVSGPEYALGLDDLQYHLSWGVDWLADMNEAGRESSGPATWLGSGDWGDAGHEQNGLS